MFEKSLKIARQQNARYQYALTLSAKGQVGRESGWPESEKYLLEAQTILAELHLSSELKAGEVAGESASASLSLADRFDTLLVSGRKIASALASAAIFEEARDAALRLLARNTASCCKSRATRKTFP